MSYPEFAKYLEIPDPKNSLVRCYEDEKGNRFYVELGFYHDLLGFKEKREERFGDLMKALDEKVKKEGKVIFTNDFENPWVHEEGYTLCEILDLTDPLGIFVEDKSRGSDYGD